MKTLIYFFTLIFLVNLYSCTHHIPDDKNVGNMSVDEARRAITLGFKSNQYVKEVNFTYNRISVVWTSGSVHNYIVADMTDYKAVGRCVHVWGGQDLLCLYNGNTTEIAVANAIHVLKKNSIEHHKMLNEYANSFNASVPGYKEILAKNTPLPEEANKFKVQADAAVKDKSFAEASQHYANMIRVTPWWPAAHFNLAMILGELQEFVMAQVEMRLYLLLVPEAPNARVALDKIYEWERLEKKYSASWYK